MVEDKYLTGNLHLLLMSIFLCCEIVPSYIIFMPRHFLLAMGERVFALKGCSPVPPDHSKDRSWVSTCKKIIFSPGSIKNMFSEKIFPDKKISKSKTLYITFGISENFSI